MRILKFYFHDGQTVDIDVAEFGDDGIGAVIDHLAAMHGGVDRVE